MLRLEESNEGFKIFFKGKLYFEHKKDQSLLIVGVGKAKYEMSHGKFTITQEIFNNIHLTKYKIKKNNKKNLIIELSNNNISVNLKLISENHQLYLFFNCNDKKINRFSIKIMAPKDEKIYGCGAQSTKFNLKGHKVPLWVEESNPLWKDNFTTYFPQTSFISIDMQSFNSYFLFLETSYYSEFDFRNSQYNELLVWDVPEKIVIGSYNSIIQTLKGLSDYIGCQPPLPDWVYNGIILAIQGGSEVVKEKLKTVEKYKIPIAAIWCQDWEGIRITTFGKQLFWNWSYDPTLYPDLPSLIKSLNEENIKFLGYINPFLALEGELYKEASKMGYCVKNSQGEDYLITTTDFPSALLDLTNPEGVKWIKSIIKDNMINIGLDGWMADYGEYLPPDAILHSGVNGEEFHNRYPTIWAKIQYETIKEENKLEEILYFHRSNYSHGSKYVMLYWAGDQTVNWSEESGLPSIIKCGMSLGLSGVGNYSFDIGGFLTTDSIKRSKEIFLRWLELGTFSLVMRTHEGNRPYDNWQFDSDEETLQIISKMVKIHKKLKPYLKFIEFEYQEAGIPPIRPCFLHYEDDKELYNLDYQYLLGRDMLIAPVYLSETSNIRIYFPDDVWIHLWSLDEYKKGHYTINCPLGKPPVFFRKSSQFSSLFRDLIHSE